ncbi:MAG: MEDS domain-containing protein [bacterium]|nr:MEDS domain-containing protein [bacterium]
MYLKSSDQPIFDLGFGGHRCHWGTHICGLYGSEAERDQIIFGFLGKGLLEEDLQFFCYDLEGRDRILKGLQPFSSKSLEDSPDQLVLKPAKELYYPSGSFSPWEMDRGLSQFYEQSQAKGPRNIRASAEMSWALQAVPGVEDLMAYESRLNYFIPGKPWVSICLYDLTRFSGEVIMNVLRTHPYSISGGLITENPYYQEPDQWLAQHAPQFLDSNAVL